MSILGWTVFSTVGMLVASLLTAWKAEGYIGMARSADSRYRIYGRVARLSVGIAAALFLAGWFTRSRDDSTDLMFWFAALFVLLIGGWMIFFRYHRFPERRWENNVIEEPRQPPEE